MILGPGINGSTATVILRPGEALPAQYNVDGILVYESDGYNPWKMVKAPDQVLPQAPLTYREEEIIMAREEMLSKPEDSKS